MLTAALPPRARDVRPGGVCHLALWLFLGCADAGPSGGVTVTGGSSPAVLGSQAPAIAFSVSMSSSGAAPVTPNPSPEPPAPGATHPAQPGAAPLGKETQCNGLDDDANGVTDDVDGAGDGVCDCLRIGTLGLKGTWGKGEVLKDWVPKQLSAKVTTLKATDLTPESLANIDVLLLQDISAKNNPGLMFPETAASALWSWVRRGGGLMTVIGYSGSEEVTNVNALLSQFMLSYGTEPLATGKGMPVTVTELLTHASTLGIKSIGADNGYAVDGQGTALATYSGKTLGRALTLGDGHVLVWGDEWITYAADWATYPTFQVDRFWKNALKWLTKGTVCQVPLPP